MRRMHKTDHQSKQYIVGISSFERRVPMRCSKYLYVVVQPCPLKQMRGWGGGLLYHYYMQSCFSNIMCGLKQQIYIFL